MNLSAKLRKRSINIRGHATSYTLEDPFFDVLKSIANERDIALSALIAEVDNMRDKAVNLSSALRLFALHSVQAKLAQPAE